MQTIIRTLSKDASSIIPWPLVRTLELRLSQAVDLSVVDGCLVVKPLDLPRYKLSDLLAEMDGEFPRVGEWDN